MQKFIAYLALCTLTGVKVDDIDREGEQNLLMFTWNKGLEQFESQILDRGCGSANVYKYEKDGVDYLVSTN